MSERPKVGLGVWIVKDGRVLLGHRLSAHGEGTWCPPGGHIEFGESFEDCAKRETREESGLEIKDIQFLTATNDVHVKEGKHYITVYVKSNWHSNDPKVLEPDKISDWAWFEWSNLPKPLFLPVQNFLKTGIDPTKQQ